jgi:hypothetical protein
VFQHQQGRQGQKIKALIKTIAGRLPAHLAEKWQSQAKHRQQTPRNNAVALFGEARCLRQLAGPDHMPCQSPADGKNQQHSTSTESKQHAGCSFLAASAISLLGMTLLAAALLVHFLLLTSVARNGEYQNSFFFLLFAPARLCVSFCLPASLSAPDPYAPWGNKLRCARVRDLPRDENDFWD